MPGTFVSISRHGPKGQTSVRDKVDTPIPAMSGSDVRKERELRWTCQEKMPQSDEFCTHS